jgi:hypothetical protein
VNLAGGHEHALNDGAAAEHDQLHSPALNGEAGCRALDALSRALVAAVDGRTRLSAARSPSTVVAHVARSIGHEIAVNAFPISVHPLKPDRGLGCSNVSYYVLVLVHVVDLRRGVDAEDELALVGLPSLRPSQRVPRSILWAHLAPPFRSRSRSSTVT